jgi:hypothetical protein
VPSSARAYLTSLTDTVSRRDRVPRLLAALSVEEQGLSQLFVTALRCRSGALISPIGERPAFGSTSDQTSPALRLGFPSGSHQVAAAEVTREPLTLMIGRFDWARSDSKGPEFAVLTVEVEEDSLRHDGA